MLTGKTKQIWKIVLTLAIVQVGLTDHVKGLPNLGHSVTADPGPLMNYGITPGGSINQVSGMTFDAGALKLTNTHGSTSSSTITFTGNLITGNMDDGVFIYTSWYNTFITFGGANTITGNGDDDIDATADGSSPQIMQLIGAANTLGTVTYSGWSSVLP